jgi:DNA-directed RNA polymerase specialized sigma24 family protein
MQAQEQALSKGPDDEAALLTAFVEHADQQAFSRMVELYHRLIFVTCIRRLNHNVAAAEDATQAVFILLARKASRIRHAGSSKRPSR